MNRYVWLFGCVGEDVADTRLFAFWKYVAGAAKEVESYIVLDLTSPNRKLVAELDADIRGRVIWRDTREHGRLFKKADMLFAADSSADVRCSAGAAYINKPLVIVPHRDAPPITDPEFENNCLFRYVASNYAIYKYLTLAKVLASYQVLDGLGLYCNTEDGFQSTARRILDNLLYAQKNGVAFLGFALTHVGGTPVATHALAEGLLELGWLVEYICIRQARRTSTPPGIAVRALEDYLNRQPWKETRLERFLNKRAFLSYLKYDPSKPSPRCGITLWWWLRRVHMRALVSTRESMHFFAQGCRSSHVDRRVCFFHCNSEVVESVFGAAVKKLAKLRYDKAVFVTEANRVALKERFQLDNYRDSCVLGNGLSSLRMIERSEIVPVEPSDDLKVCWLVRIEDNRKDDLDNMFGFAQYLRERAVSNIKITVFGQGGYLGEFLKRIKAQGLENIVSHGGVSNDVKDTYGKYDVVVDFSKVQSFGMVYIEAILNGKMVFCYRNEGSSEVLRDIPEAFFETNEELLEKLQHVRGITLETLQSNYDKIASRFSRQAIARKFIEFIES